MDILNWVYLIKNKFTRTTVENPATDLVVLGADVSYQKRGDKYQNYVMTVEDFLASAARPYKVYTALLTQSGGDDELQITGGTLTVGVSYQVDINTGGADFTNVGAPNNEIGTWFVATGTTPTSWGTGALLYNTGAPVVTVLENTIGNIYWTYSDVGYYLANLNGAFTEGKTIAFFGAQQSTGDEIGGYPESINYYAVYSWFEGVANDGTSERPIEIRVYN
jgi:hypothetical protein